MLNPVIKIVAQLYKQSRKNCWFWHSILTWGAKYNHGSECVYRKITIFKNNYPCKILKV